MTDCKKVTTMVEGKGLEKIVSEKMSVCIRRLSLYKVSYKLKSERS